MKTIKLDSLPNNSILKLRPELYGEWDFEKNSHLDIYKMTKGMARTAWWVCEECKGSYPQRIDSKFRGSGCAICAGKYVTKENCVLTTNPDIANLMVDRNNGLLYTSKSDKRLDFKCPDCDSVIKNKQIKNITVSGLKCPICSDGFSYPEKIMYGLLQSLQEEFLYDKAIFSDRKRYDFYLPDKSIIIEMHGGQHYPDVKGFSMSTNTIEDIQKNDSYKREIALQNGIKHYIVIDSRHSNIEWMKKNIVNSDLQFLIDLQNIDWNFLDSQSASSNKVKCLNMYLDGNKELSSIASQLHVEHATVWRWMKQWADIGKCNYQKEDTRKKVYQLDKNNNLVKVWESSWEARKEYKNVNKVLKGERPYCKNYKFMHEENYMELLEQ